MLLSGCSTKEKLSEQLYAAIHQNDYKTVKQILDSTNYRKLPTQEKTKPEVLAATLNEEKITLALLKAGASWKSKDVNKNNILQIAAINGNEKLIHYLLNQKNVNINMKNDLGMTPLLLSIAPTSPEPDRLEIVKWLIKNGANPLDHSMDGSTVLHVAALQNQPAVINFLLSNKQIINAKDHEGRTPLMIAVQSGNVNSVKELLNGGSNPSIKDSNGKTAKMYAKDYHLTKIEALFD
jgi:ankyrin repeat protein